MEFYIKNKHKMFLKAPGAGVTSNKAYAYKYSLEAAQIYMHDEDYDVEEIVYKKFKSIKVFDGFSTNFRQWRASDTHCSFLHGYAISFEITFKGELDERNWVWDFGGMKRSSNEIDGMNPKKWMDYMFDHTTIIAKDDPQLEHFKLLNSAGVIQLRIIPAVGAERFAEYIFNKVNDFVKKETDGRVEVSRVKFMENNKNSAIYEE